MSLYTDMTLAPLQLEDEFDAQDQEPDRDTQPPVVAPMGPEVVAAPSVGASFLASAYDDLGLRSDPHLGRFFETIEGHHLPMREVLLLSAHAHLRPISEALFQESRRPVVQGTRRRNKTNQEDQTKEEQRRKEANSQRRQSGSTPGATGTSASAAAAAAATSTSAVYQSSRSTVPAPSAAEAVSGASPAKPGFWQRIRAPSTPDRTPSPGIGIGVGVVPPAVSSGSHGGLSTSPPPPSKSSRMADWFRKKIGADDKQQLASQHQALPRHSPSLLLNESSPPPYALQSPTFTYSNARAQAAPPNAFTLPNLAQSRSRSGSLMASPEVTRTGPASPSHQMATAQERAARAPQAEAPQPCTLVLTNLALYIFPPAIPIELDSDPTSPMESPGGTKLTKHFLVYTEYQRIALQDVLLVSLPYRSGLTRHGADFALRITDFALHLRDGDTTVWLQAPRNKRSRVVECISDAYSNLMGLPLEMTQPDYSELLYDILTKKIWSQIREFQIQKWALSEPIQAGYLFHRSLHVWPSLVEASAAGGAANPPPKIEMKMSAPSDWRRQWFVLSQDNYLLHFASPEELQAFQFVATSSSLSGATAATAQNGKFPASFDCNQIDLSKSLYLRGSSVCPDGFEIICYPRASSMQSGSAHDHSTAATLQYGYTRHLFQIPLPAVPAKTGVTLVGSKASLGTPAVGVSSSGAPDRSPALNAWMEAEVNKWLVALRSAMKGPGLQEDKEERKRRDSEVATVHAGDAAAALALHTKSNRLSGTFGAGTPALMRDGTFSLALESLNTQAAAASFTVLGRGNVEDDPEIDTIRMSPSASPDSDVLSPQPIDPSASPPPPTTKFLDTTANEPPPPAIASPDGPALDSLTIKPPNFREEPDHSLLSPGVETPQLP